MLADVGNGWLEVLSCRSWMLSSDSKLLRLHLVPQEAETQEGIIENNWQ